MRCDGVEADLGTFWSEAVTFFERAKGSATAKPNPEQEDLSPLVCIFVYI